MKDDDDYDSYFEDTMCAGHYRNNRTAVDIMLRSSKSVIEDLISYGINFERDEDGKLLFTKEGAHSKPRILFHADITGKEITSHLLNAVRSRKNIKIIRAQATLYYYYGIQKHQLQEKVFGVFEHKVC